MKSGGVAAVEAPGKNPRERGASVPEVQLCPDPALYGLVRRQLTPRISTDLLSKGEGKMHTESSSL